ncbi:protein RTF1 homolog [Phalaenopsis equestris]|uniref:protein RTF1 homolog n=1 Tax=Phalaenopsis equestris TaxID=78828 RepID=UPI0009E3D662|nr:protein RTF1 homolog [Phalaenopsis equestris]
MPPVEILPCTGSRKRSIFEKEDSVAGRRSAADDGRKGLGFCFAGEREIRSREKLQLNITTRVPISTKKINKRKHFRGSNASNMQAVRRTRQHELKSYFRLIDSNGVISSKSESESDDREEGKMCDGIDVDDSLDDSVTSKSRPIRYEDVKEITICRSKLAKWFMEPFFEEIIVGCFVRIGIGRTRNGPKYKLCVVKNVDATNPNRKYKIEDRTTCKWLNCVWGNEAFAARWQMAMVSNHPPTEQEFKEWLGETERCERDIPCRQYVHDKIEEIKKTSAFICSPIL